MRVWLKGKPVSLIPGMTVRQALIGSDLLKEVEKGARVFDEWGHEMGLDGALEEGMRLELRTPKETNHKDPS
jgi:hypothetical protein